MKRKSQHESDTQSLNETPEHSHFEMKLSDKIDGGLSWLRELQQALHQFFVHGNLKTLIDGWSGTSAVPVLAYVWFEDVTYRGSLGK